MQVVLSHPTGNRNVRAVLAGLLQYNSLAEFATTIAIDPASKWVNTVPVSLRKELLRRTFAVSSKQIFTHPNRELCRMLLPKLGLKNITRHETGWACVDNVYRDFDRAVARRLPDLKKNKQATAVYAYEDGALATFTKAKALGLQCVYDLPIAYWQTARKLLLEEADRMPQWKKTLGGGIRDSSEKLERKTKELEFADVVVTPGQFVRDSLPAWANNKKVIVSQFGSPDVCSPSNVENPSQRNNRPLRVLFVGSMGQRKGLGDLFSAMKFLNTKNIELIVMGSLLDSMEFYKHELPSFTFAAGRPHNEVLALMQTCDVFCLPSIVEGRALVMQEAMSQGLPLIITSNTGGADLVIEDKTGFLVPVRSPEKIAEKIDWFAANREAAVTMGEAAKAHAARYTWQKYEETIVNELNTFLN